MRLTPSPVPMGLLHIGIIDIHPSKLGKWCTMKFQLFWRSGSQDAQKTWQLGLRDEWTRTEAALCSLKAGNVHRLWQNSGCISIMIHRLLSMSVLQNDKCHVFLTGDLTERFCPGPCYTARLKILCEVNLTQQSGWPQWSPWPHQSAPQVLSLQREQIQQYRHI